MGGGRRRPGGWRRPAPPPPRFPVGPRPRPLRRGARRGPPRWPRAPPHYYADGGVALSRHAPSARRSAAGGETFLLCGIAVWRRAPALLREEADPGREHVAERAISRKEEELQVPSVIPSSSNVPARRMTANTIYRQDVLSVWGFLLSFGCRRIEETLPDASPPPASPQGWGFRGSSQRLEGQFGSFLGASRHPLGSCRTTRIQPSLSPVPAQPLRPHLSLC
nr:uncharacterized protein LOC115841590 [Globicephala melas]